MRFYVSFIYIYDLLDIYDLFTECGLPCLTLPT